MTKIEEMFPIPMTAEEIATGHENLDLRGKRLGAVLGAIEAIVSLKNPRRREWNAWGLYCRIERNTEIIQRSEERRARIHRLGEALILADGNLSKIAKTWGVTRARVGALVKKAGLQEKARELRTAARLQK